MLPPIVKLPAISPPVLNVKKPDFNTLNLVEPPTCNCIKSDSAALAVSVIFTFNAMGVPVVFQVCERSNKEVAFVPVTVAVSEITTRPAVVSIALKFAAAVKIGLIYKPLVIPFAPPVWLIVQYIFKKFTTALPLVGAKPLCIETVLCTAVVVPVILAPLKVT